MPQSNIMPGFRPAIGLTLVYLAIHRADSAERHADEILAAQSR